MKAQLRLPDSFTIICLFAMVLIFGCQVTTELEPYYDTGDMFTEVDTVINNDTLYIWK